MSYVVYLISYFAAGDSLRSSTPSNDYKLPSLSLGLYFTLQFADQVIFYRLLHLERRCIPGHTSTNLPRIGFEPGKPG